tara:strand:- start:729 stop:1007 length:279 start_codon:yes stop_codon:yes gene_type:complete
MTWKDDTMSAKKKLAKINKDGSLTVVRQGKGKSKRWYEAKEAGFPMCAIWTNAKRNGVSGSWTKITHNEENLPEGFPISAFVSNEGEVMWSR